ncbi:MAG: 6-carboxytetrahydropterin synthase QueD [Syntrophales bacterium]|jgi:6-pyruvoyltetrahydropterin/6-carboxytetrahydropterin synthase|nr:6-carboxytetrahydropterin synthase QueD [Syntrophales bacterium]
MYEVTIKRAFSAAHSLKEIGGKCEKLHGHNFTVEVSVATDQLNREGLVVDFRVIKTWTDETLRELDHKYLNEISIFRGANPSSENIARHIYDQIARRITTPGLRVSRVIVWESENAKVAYTGPDHA